MCCPEARSPSPPLTVRSRFIPPGAKPRARQFWLDGALLGTQPPVRVRRSPMINPWQVARVSLLALVLTLPLLQGCAGALIAAGVGAAVGATVVVRDRRGEEAVLADKEIEFKAKDWPGSGSGCQVAATSYNRVVLLTGQCRDEAARQRYAERIGKIPGVKQVLDETSVGPFASLQQQADDTLITSRLKIELVQVRLPGFDPTRVTIVTESGVVYLMGLVTPAEAEATVDKARYTPGVVRVVKIFETWNGEAGNGEPGKTETATGSGSRVQADAGGRVTVQAPAAQAFPSRGTGEVGETATGATEALMGRERSERIGSQEVARTLVSFLPLKTGAGHAAG